MSDEGKIVGCKSEHLEHWATYCHQCDVDTTVPELCPKEDILGDVTEFTPIRETRFQTMVRKAKWKLRTVKQKLTKKEDLFR